MATSSRDTIYGAKLNPLTETEKGHTAVISPTLESAPALAEVLLRVRMEEVYMLLTEGKPFLLGPPKAASAGGTDTFKTNRRYGANEQIATNVIGYLDGSGMDVAGIEKAYQEFLPSNPGEVTVSYQMDAVNRILPGESKEATDISNKNKKDVVLALGAEIQALTEQSAKKYLKKGTVVITETPNEKIRTMVSLSDFSSNDLQSALDNPDSPLLNRAVSAYNVGSVFKVIPATATLEDGVSPSTAFTCARGIEVGGGVHHCYSGKARDTLDMQGVITQSCNTYFVELMQQMLNETFLSMVKSLGLGQGLTLAPGYVSTAENLPEKDELLVPHALANFSFGQGVLTVTPVQIAELMNAVASGGLYMPLSLMQGLVDENLQYAEAAEQAESVWVMSQDTATQLRQFIGVAIEDGATRKGKLAFGGARVETGTVQTGQFESGKEIVQGWYTRFSPFESPRYSIVVLSEDTQRASDGTSIFQEIVNALISKTN